MDERRAGVGVAGHDGDPSRMIVGEPGPRASVAPSACGAVVPEVLGQRPAGVIRADAPRAHLRRGQPHHRCHGPGLRPGHPGDAGALRRGSAHGGGRRGHGPRAGLASRIAFRDHEPGHGGGARDRAGRQDRLSGAPGCGRAIPASDGDPVSTPDPRDCRCGRTRCGHVHNGCTSSRLQLGYSTRHGATVYILVHLGVIDIGLAPVVVALLASATAMVLGGCSDGRNPGRWLSGSKRCTGRVLPGSQDNYN